MILGASYDSPEDNRAFQEKFNFPFDLLSDPDQVAGAAYGVVQEDKPYPSRFSFLIDPDGNIAKVYDTVVPSGSIRKLHRAERSGGRQGLFI